MPKVKSAAQKKPKKYSRLRKRVEELKRKQAKKLRGKPGDLKARRRVQIFLEQPKIKRLMASLDREERAAVQEYLKIFEKGDKFDTGDVGDLIECLPLEKWRPFAELAVRDSRPETYWARSRAIIEIGEAKGPGSRKLIPLIEAQIKDKNVDVRRAAVKALIKLKSKQSYSLVKRQIEKALKDKSEDNRVWGINMLAALDGKKSIPVIEEFLKDSSSLVRRRTIDALAELGSRQSLPLIENLLKNPAVKQDEYVWEHAIDFFVKFKAKSAIPLIESQLTGPIPWAAVRALGQLKSKKFKSKKTVSKIRQFLKSRSVDKREVAVYALGMLGSKEDIQTLVKMRDDPNEDVRYRVDEALHKLAASVGISRLYVEQVGDKKFFDPRQLYRPKKFTKTGSELILFGGRMVGKTVARVIDEKPLKAWKKALRAKKVWQQAGFDYVPVEPILRKRGKQRIYWQSVKGKRTGKVRVYTSVLGPSVFAFLNQPGNKKKKNY